MIGLICSVDFECVKIHNELSKGRTFPLGGLEFIRGGLSGKEVVLTASGVGKTNAAHATTLMAERFHPRLIINFGVGGAYPGSGPGVCTIAVADREIYGDEGVLLANGFRDMRFLGLPLLSISSTSGTGSDKDIYNEIPLDRGLADKISSLLEPAKTAVGPFVTLSCMTGSGSRAESLRRRYGAICENMEGASVAHVCQMHGIPFLEIRGISNIVEERDKGKWKLKEASGICQEALLEVIEKI